MAPQMSFQPRWKEELVCTSEHGSFVLDMPMGVVGVYFPTQASWANSAPAWALPFWREIHEQLRTWCSSQRVPLHVEDGARVYRAAATG